MTQNRSSIRRNDSRLGLIQVNPVNNYSFSGGNYEISSQLNSNEKPNYTTSSNNIERSDDLYTVLKPYLIWGQIIGLLPFQFIGKKLTNLEFRWLNFWTFYMLFVTFGVFSNVVIAIMGLSQQQNATAIDLAYSLQFPMFYFNGFFMYQHFVRNSKQFLEIFKTWSILMPQSNLDLDKSFRKFVIFWSLIIFLSAILENAVFHIRIAPIINSAHNESTFLEIYIVKTHTYWSLFVPYHWTISLLLFFTNKWALYAWNYVDLSIAIFSRAISIKLIALRKGNKWETYNQDFKIIAEIFRKFEKFLSPLIFYSYLINIYALCIHVHSSLFSEKNFSIVESVYENWAYIHLVLRLFLVTLYSAQVHHEFVKVHLNIQLCPKEFFNDDMERLERLAGQYYAFNGMGCFYISYPIILAIIHVLFTFEIVLLQTTSSMLTQKN